MSGTEGGLSIGGRIDADPDEAVAEALGTAVASSDPLSGGMVGRVSRIRTTDGRTVILKTSAGVDLRIEAAMLRTLHERSPLPVPKVLDAREGLLILEDLPGRTGLADVGAQRHLAELLAATHEASGPAFGFEHDTLLGPYRLPNHPTDDGVAFFRDLRLRWALGVAVEAGTLPNEIRTRIERIAERSAALLSDHRPEPVLLHGDLWSGNVLSEPGRVTGVLDPALHHGDAETELAFVDLFGGVGDAFWERYAALRPVDPAFHAWRKNLWQLVPLLVHVALFGASYVSALNDRVVRVEEQL